MSAQRKYETGVPTPAGEVLTGLGWASPYTRATTLFQDTVETGKTQVLRERVKHLETRNKELQESYDRMLAQWKVAVATLQAMRKLVNSGPDTPPDIAPDTTPDDELAALVSLALRSGWSTDDNGVLFPPRGDESERWAATWEKVDVDGRAVWVPHWFRKRFLDIERIKMRSEKEAANTVTSAQDAFQQVEFANWQAIEFPLDLIAPQEEQITSLVYAGRSICSINKVDFVTLPVFDIADEAIEDLCLTMLQNAASDKEACLTARGIKFPGCKHHVRDFRILKLPDRKSIVFASDCVVMVRQGGKRGMAVLDSRKVAYLK